MSRKTLHKIAKNKLFEHIVAWEQIGWHSADNIFGFIFLNGNCCILIESSLRFVLKGPIDIKSALVQVMAWCQMGQAVTWANIDKELHCHMASLGSNELTACSAFCIYNIGIDHDTVCAGVVCTAIRHSMSCAGRCAAAPAGTTSAGPDCSTNHDSADRISGQFLFYHDHNFTKSKGNSRFQRLVPLFVPIGICVTTHDDGTASDVTIGMWRHNQQARTTSAMANLGFHSQSSLAM